MSVVRSSNGVQGTQNLHARRRIRLEAAFDRYKSYGPLSVRKGNTDLSNNGFLSVHVDSADCMQASLTTSTFSRCLDGA